MNSLINDKHMTYNPKLKVVGKFSNEKNSFGTNSNVKESITNESGVYINRGQKSNTEFPICQNDFNGPLDNSIEKSVAMSDNLPIKNDRKSDRLNVFHSPIELRRSEVKDGFLKEKIQIFTCFFFIGKT